MFIIVINEYLELKVNEIYKKLLFDLDTIYESFAFIKEITDYNRSLLCSKDWVYQKELKIVEETDYVESETLYYLAFINLHAKLLYKTGYKNKAKKYWDNIIKNRFFKIEYFFADDYTAKPSP